jgi:hypothetical protein
MHIQFLIIFDSENNLCVVEIKTQTIPLNVGDIYLRVSGRI